MQKFKNPLRHQKPKKRRKKSQKQTHIRWVLWSIPLVCCVIFLVLLQSLSIDPFFPKNHFKPKKIEVISHQPIDPQMKESLLQDISTQYRQSKSPSLSRLVHYIQKKWAFESVNLTQTPHQDLWIRVKNRSPVAFLNYNQKKYPITATAEIYKGHQHITWESLLEMQGVLDNNPKRKWRRNHSLELQPSEKNTLGEALQLHRALQVQGLIVTNITHKKHRGYHVQLDDSLEITFGYAPFEDHLEKLARLQQTKRSQWSNIKKIELDFQNKVFIAYKS
ncbi:MAG: hypothetical protein AB8C84_07955 [Oligoflexales bacterium]